MNNITRSLKIEVPSETAFRKFVHELNKWWPKAYTWSQEKLRDIKIDGKKDGLCTEIGPFGFRCDWGRVTEITENKLIKLKWQISPDREPIPNPENASDLYVNFVQEGNVTVLKFEHLNFENHGEGSADYKKIMDSRYGWDLILENFKKYCENT